MASVAIRLSRRVVVIVATCNGRRDQPAATRGCYDMLRPRRNFTEEALNIPGKKKGGCAGSLLRVSLPAREFRRIPRLLQSNDGGFHRRNHKDGQQLPGPKTGNFAEGSGLKIMEQGPEKREDHTRQITPTVIGAARDLVTATRSAAEGLRWQQRTSTLKAPDCRAARHDGSCETWGGGHR